MTNLPTILSRMLTGCCLLIQLSCSKAGCPVSAGSTATETRPLPPFTSIVLCDKVNLILTEDSKQVVTVEAGRNLLQGISTIVADSALTIHNNNGCSWIRDADYQINVYISTASLNSIIYNGAGNIWSINTLHEPSFRIDSYSGTGSVKLSLVTGHTDAIIRSNNATITLTGSGVDTYVYCADAGAVNLLSFPSQTVVLQQKSVRDLYVNVTNSFTVDILYQGNVYFKGNPPVMDSLITSGGKLIHLE